MRVSKKDKDMRMLRTAGLSLASADRLAGSTGGTPITAYVLGGLAVLALAGTGVLAMNLQAQQTGNVIAAAPDPLPAIETPAIDTPVVKAPSDAVAVAKVAFTDVSDTKQPELYDLPWITAQIDPVEEPAAEPVADCVTDLSQALSGLMFNFDPGSAEIRSEDYDLLVSVGQQTVACPLARVMVEGHSDTTGTDVLNLQLSWQRADNAVSVLEQLGIDTTQFETVGFGARTPLTQGSATDDEINRRVELRVTREGSQL